MFLFKSSVKVKSDHFYIFQINLQLAELMSPKAKCHSDYKGNSYFSNINKACDKNIFNFRRIFRKSHGICRLLYRRVYCKFNLYICFFTCHGVNQNGIIVDTALAETQLRKNVVLQSAKSVFLCDKSKFNTTTLYNLMSVCDVITLLQIAKIQADSLIMRW